MHIKSQKMTSAPETCKHLTDLALPEKFLILPSQTWSGTDGHVCSLCLKWGFLQVKDLFPSSAIFLMKLIFLMKWFRAKGRAAWGLLSLQHFCVGRILGATRILPHPLRMVFSGLILPSSHSRGEVCACARVCTYLCLHTNATLTPLNRRMKKSL